MKRVQRIFVGVSLLFICGLLISAVVPNVPSGTWEATSDMAAPRTGATATLFPDGRLMIVGGTDANGEPLASAEFYNADGSVSAAPSMSVARSGHAAIFLYDGRLLVTGGRVSGGGITNSAEVFDPLTNHWQMLSSTLLNARAGHTVSQLADGSVLIAGGEDSSGPVSALEVFDLYNNFNAAGSLNTARKDHAAAVLPNGRVLIAGGTGYAADSSVVTLNSTEIYDPDTNSVTAGPDMSAARAKHSATTLLDGRVLITGGNNGSNDLATAEIYNPATGAISATDSMSAPRSGHTALLLPNNNAVLIAGGTSAGDDSASAELYESWNNAFKSTGSMTAARTAATASATAYDGLAMLAGGSNLASTELYGFATVKTDWPEYVPGDTVKISGSGWQPSETVTLRIHEVPTTDPDVILTAVADAAGNIANQQFSVNEGDLGVKFYLSAKGSASEAQTSFLDAPKVGSVVVGAQAPSSIIAGNAATFAITVSRGTGSGSNGSFTANLSVTTTLPTGATASFAINPLSFAPADSAKSTTLTINTTASTPAGSTNFTVRASTSASDFADNSGTLVVTAATVNTTTTITSDTPDPSVVGQSVAVNYTVAPNSGSGTPTGNVTVSDGTNSCTGTVAAGSCSITFTSPGAKSLTATYAGDTGFNGSTSASVSHQVNRGDTTTSITSDTPDPSTIGQSVTVNYAVSPTSPAAGTPTGNVTVSDGVNSCTGTVAAGTCNITLTTAGSRTLTATYAGDTNFNGSTSAGEPHTVEKITTAASITADTPDPSVVGQLVTVQYSVSHSGSGTPTGNVTVSDGTFSCTGTVAAGNCSLTFTNTGAKSLTATYAGDSTFEGSTSAAASHQVNKADTTTTISSDTPDPSVVGQPVAVSFAVSVNSPGSGSPTGNVTVSDGTSSCTATVTVGSCSITFTTAGAKSLTATYAGDSDFNGSTSASEPHQVDKGNTTTTITSDNPDPSVVGQAVTVNYAVVATAPASGSPTGNVTVSDGTTSCTATVAAGSCVITFTSAGAKTLTATYAGDSNFNGSTSASEGHTVNKADTTTTISSDSPDPSVFGQSVMVQFNVSVNAPGSGTPTGNVTVSDGTQSCTATVAAGQCSLTFNSVGGKTLTASYAGDTNFNSSTSAGEPHTVDKGDTTTTITTDGPDPSVVGQSVTVDFTVVAAAPAVGTPTGNVTVSDGSISCTASVSAGSCSLTFTSAGARTLTATYVGDDNFNGSSDTEAHVVNKADTTTAITSDSPDPSVVGQSITVNYTVSVLAPGVGTPTGNVTVSDGTDSCTGTVAAGTCTLTPTSAGAKTMTATYAGDSNFNTSSDTETHQVDKGDTTTTITSDTPDPSVVGQLVTVSFAIAVTPPATGTPTGNVTVSDGTDSCTATVAVGNCAITFTSAGTKNLTATYGGDSNFNGSTSASAPHTVNKADTTTSIIAHTPDPSVYGQAVIVSFAVSVSAPGAGTPTGNVTVSDGANSCTGTVAAGTCSITLTTVGNRTLAATYGGDTNFNGSTSAGTAHTVNKADTTTTITSDAPDASILGQLVTVNFVVVASSPGSGTPTGNVTVSDGVVSCTASVATGSCSLTPTSVGPKTLTATYSGDSNFNGSADTEFHSVIYAPGGSCLGSPGHAILQPINADGTSVFKQRSTVPAKFRVCDVNGNSIGAPVSVVSSFRLVQKMSGTITQVIDEAVDSTTPDSYFRWDPTAQQWIFNMNTKNLQANTTYYYVITLNDSSSIEFMFGLK